MVTVAIAIVTHPARHQQAMALRANVGSGIIVVDVNGQGERWCHTRALEIAAAQDCDWAVILEDDALPCENFRQELDNALQQAPPGIVSLYLGTGRWAGTNPRRQVIVVRDLINNADAHGDQWITTNAMWHAVGIAVRREHTASLTEHLGRVAMPTDQAVTLWATMNATPVNYAWPSLVDHDDGERLVDAHEGHVVRKAWKVR